MTQTPPLLPPLSALARDLPADVPFVGPEAAERRMGRRFALRLGANEQRFGPSPRAVAAMQAAAGDVWMYGDPEGHDLRRALAAKHGCGAENIVLGEGVDGLLGLIARLCIAPGDIAATTRGSYPTFPYHVTGYGGELSLAAYQGPKTSPERLLDAARGAKLLYIANPDNPMGSHHSAEVILQMIEALPQGCLMVLDEAYIDFAPAGTAPPIAADDPRVIRLRSFSKSYGLAGLRLGYAICAPSLARAFDKVRNHFALGRLVQVGGLAALEDDAHVAAVLKGTQAARARLAQIADALGITALPSATNFTCLELGRGPDYAARVLAALAADGVFIRKPSAAPNDGCLRISHGTAADLDAFETALTRVTSSA